MIWHTLAVSVSGTHKMRFHNEMDKIDAIATGKKHCLEKRLTYVGTFDTAEIDGAELKFRASEAYANWMEQSNKVGTPFRQLFEGYEGGKPEPLDQWDDGPVGKEIL